MDRRLREMDRRILAGVLKTKLTGHSKKRNGLAVKRNGQAVLAGVLKTKLIRRRMMSMNSSGYLALARHGLKLARYGFKLAHHGLNFAQNGLKFACQGLKLPTHGLKIARHGLKVERHRVGTRHPEMCSILGFEPQLPPGRRSGNRPDRHRWISFLCIQSCQASPGNSCMD